MSSRISDVSANESVWREYEGVRALLAGQGSRLLPQLERELAAQGGKVVLVDLEVSDSAARADVARSRADGILTDAFARLDGLDVLVCHPIARAHGPASEVRAKTWRSEVERAVGQAFEWGQAGARAMASEGGGVIVYLLSPDAFHAYAGRSAAAALGGALLGLVRGLAVDFAPLAIRVVGVAHGPVTGGSSASSLPEDPELVARTLQRAPGGRLTSPADVAAGVRFVAGPRAAFMTGQVLRFDGGWASLNQAPQGMRFP